MVNRSRQNNGYPWQSEGKRGNFNVPSHYIPTLKQIAYKLDTEQVTGDLEPEITVTETEIIIRIKK